ncbi:MAG: radical SAM protein [Candidatus Hydrogenedens sp.]|nr:radical SAM protein [Candidatus Hydrogenedens sp.]
MEQKMFSLGNLARIWSGRAPGQLIIQMTDQCNARCPQCEMRVTNQYDRKTMSVDAMKRAIDAAAANGIQALSFTGGEPLLMLDEMAPLMKHAGSLGIPFIRSGTNGYVFKNPEAAGWEDRVKRIADMLADTPVRNFWISIDSVVPEVHEKMRGFPGLIKGIERAIPIFRERGLYPSANLGVNRNVGGTITWDIYPENFASEDAYLDSFYRGMRGSLQKFYAFVRDLGFTIANTCYPMSIDTPEMQQGLAAVYGATSLDRVIRFTRGERLMLFKALFETVPEYRGDLRIFSPRSSLLSLMRQYEDGAKAEGYGCRGGVDFFFVNSVDGNTYPCGYRGNESFGKFEDLDLAKIDRKASCTDCDWECFRDPSELVGPLLEGVHNPFALAARWMRDPEFFKLWREDLVYYKACEYFSGRRDMNLDKLAKFESGKAEITYVRQPVAA